MARFFNWTPENEQFVKDNYETMTALQMAETLGTTRSTVKNRVYVMGIIKSHNPGNIKTGNVPPNKGLKMSTVTKAKLAHTWFKKGNKPHNTMYNGHERISKDGYIEIRVSEGNYQHKQRVVWEQHNGPIPEGYIITFKDGIKTNVDISNLDLISRKYPTNGWLYSVANGTWGWCWQR